MDFAGTPAMKLASFEVETRVGPAIRIGVLASDEETLIDVTTGYAAARDDAGEEAPWRFAEATAPPDMIEFLAAGDRAIDAARTAREFVETRPDQRGFDGRQLRYPVDDVRLLSPLPRPNSIRDFMVVEEHVRNALGDDIPDVWFDLPIYYKGDADCIGHPGEDIEWPAYTEQLDYELELAAVIGRDGRDIAADDADEYIAGYTIYNDFSARDIQFEEMAADLGPAKGKDFDGSNAFGPYLVTRDALDIDGLSMTARINDEVWSEGELGAWQHTFGEMIEHVSQNLTIRTGDVFGSGTVGMGCGLEMDRFLSPGDTVELEVSGIGTLRNRVIKV